VSHFQTLARDIYLEEDINNGINHCGLNLQFTGATRATNNRIKAAAYMSYWTKQNTFKVHMHKSGFFCMPQLH